MIFMLIISNISYDQQITRVEFNARSSVEKSRK
jgi:hypothetical protein